MKNILTAVGNPNLNEELKKEFKIEYKDIQYKEGILEILENNNKIDLIIINEKLPGKIEINNLIEKILIINSKIKIYLIIEDEKNINKKENIYFLKYNEINYQIIKEKIILENIKKTNIKNIQEINNKNNIKQNNDRNFNYLYNNIKIKNYKEKNVPQYICILGQSGIGKTIFSVMLAIYLSKKQKRILLVDMDTRNGNMHTIFQIKKNINKIQKIKNNINFICGENIENNNYDFILIDNYKKNNKILNKNYKTIFITESNLIGIEKTKKILFEFNNKNFNNNILILNYYNKNSIDKKIIKKFFIEIKNIKELRYDNKFNLLINNFNEFYLNIYINNKYKKIFNFIYNNLRKE